MAMDGNTMGQDICDALGITDMKATDDIKLMCVKIVNHITTHAHITVTTSGQATAVTPGTGTAPTTATGSATIT